MPDAAITTDIIVGFPGETDDDFEATLDVVRQARFASAFTFQYSPRPGTPAATYDDQVPPEVVQGALRAAAGALRTRSPGRRTSALVGRRVELLVAEGEGRKDGATMRLSGRAPDNRLVHFTPGRRPHPRPGDVVVAEVTYAAPHHLVSDVAVDGVRRTRAGDAWQSRQSEASDGVPSGERPGAAGAAHDPRLGRRRAPDGMPVGALLARCSGPSCSPRSSWFGLAAYQHYSDYRAMADRTTLVAQAWAADPTTLAQAATGAVVQARRPLRAAVPAGGRTA